MMVCLLCAIILFSSWIICIFIESLKDAIKESNVLKDEQNDILNQIKNRL